MEKKLNKNDEKKPRTKISSGTIWEEVAGFSRAIRVDNRILIAGTTATSQAGIVGKDNPAEQMHFILDRIEQSIKELGGTLNEVIRTRIFIRDIKDWEIVAKIHGEKFNAIKPVCTLVQAQLVGECLVEVEAEAVIA